jgi:hypothetical protein
MLFIISSFPEADSRPRFSGQISSSACRSSTRRRRFTLDAGYSR